MLAIMIALCRSASKNVVRLRIHHDSAFLKELGPLGVLNMLGAHHREGSCWVAIDCPEANMQADLSVLEVTAKAVLIFGNMGSMSRIACSGSDILNISIVHNSLDLGLVEVVSRIMDQVDYRSVKRMSHRRRPF